MDKKELKSIFLKIKKDNPKGLEELYSQYHKMVYGIAFSIVKNKEDVEDIMQIVFTKIQELDKTKLPSDKEVTWLYTLAKNETINYLKKKKGEVSLDTIYEIENKNNEIDEKTDTIKVEFVPGTYENETSFEESNTESGNTTNRQVPKSVTTTEEYEEGYGYYRIVVNGEETGRYDVWHWHMRRVTKDNTVQVIMEPYLIEVTEFPVICEYSLESSNYEKKFELTYMGRKDMGVKKIAEKNQFDNLDFGIYTIAGDVSITIEGDMVYSLEDALKQGVIKVQDILEQAKQDEKYRFCEEAYYQDGGSTEYRYAEYTILKYNTLDGNKDLVIGMQGSIINQMNASGYRAE